MKTLKTIFIASFLILLFTIVTLAKGESSTSADEKQQLIVKSLLLGLNSENYGLRMSSAQMLGELRINSAVIPLMKMLHSEKNPEARIVAALALYKIGNPKGLFAVKQAIKFDESFRVRKLCNNFYNDFVTNTVQSEVNLANK